MKTMMPNQSADAKPSVFDSFPWWDPADVLTQITPTRFAYIVSVTGNMDGRKVLDLGCGGGLLAEPLARAGAKVVGVDVSEAALTVAREHSKGSRLEIDYKLAAAEELPFEDEAFDIVAAFDVLDHVADLGRTISQVSRVLRPGGKFVYDTMNRTLLCRIIVIWIGENLWKGGPPKGTHDWQKFVKPEELIALLTQHNITNMETRGFIPKGIDLQGHLKMGFSSFKGLSYVGYGVKRGIIPSPFVK